MERIKTRKFKNLKIEYFYNPDTELYTYQIIDKDKYVLDEASYFKFEDCEQESLIWANSIFKGENGPTF